MGESDRGQLWKKDARELIWQMNHSVGSQKTKDLTQGLTDNKVHESLQKLSESTPAEYQSYLEQLRKKIGETESEVNSSFESFFASHPETEESKKRVTEIEKIVVKDGEPTPEQSRVIREMFPSGNFLEHSSSVRGSLAISGDPDVSIKSPEEIRKTNPKFTGQGGVWGISFGYNNVDAMPGTWRHMVIYLTSPESALNENRKLVVPYRANPHELQLVGRSYDREMAVYTEATYDFFEKRNSLDEDGVKDDFFEIETPVVYEKGLSPIERDLNRLKNGDLDQSEISSKYRVVDGEFIVNPDVNEQEVSLGLIFSDYLLKYTTEGISLGKELQDLGPQDLLRLFHQTKYKRDEIEARMVRVAEGLKSSMSISFGIEKTVVFVPEGDLDRWLAVYSRINRTPALIVTFKNAVGPKVPNWTYPVGHKDRASGMLKKLLQRAGVPDGGLSYESILGKTEPEWKVMTENTGTGYLKWETIKESKDVIFRDGQLSVDTQDLVPVYEKNG